MVRVSSAKAKGLRVRAKNKLKKERKNGGGVTSLI
jgi:hypothetical protein